MTRVITEKGRKAWSDAQRRDWDDPERRAKRLEAMPWCRVIPELEDPIWLTARYVDEGMTTRAIAIQLGCSHGKVGKSLREAGIPTRPRSYRADPSPRKGATWNSYRAMRRRCLDPKNNRYHLYGALGVTICARWMLDEPRDQGFFNFLEDMGERPAGRTIDRINPNGNYEPGNCRWATASQQARNLRPVTPERRAELNAKLSKAWETRPPFTEATKAKLSASQLRRWQRYREEMAHAGKLCRSSFMGADLEVVYCPGDRGLHGR